MAAMSLVSFEDPRQHADVSDIIRRHSTNAADVRSTLLADVDLSAYRRVLDLGCGFGFMIEAIAPRLADDAEIIGIDACPLNEAPYLERVAAAGRQGRFEVARLEERLDFDAQSFDLVIGSYALYFFPRILPEVARVQRRDGLFIAVTHTESSCRDLLRATGLPQDDARLLGSIRNFSAENGAALLSPWFADVHRVDYLNTLRFEPAQYDRFLKYLRFKLPLLEPETGFGGAGLEPLAGPIRDALRAQSEVVLEKNDAAFFCRGPRCR